MENKRTWIYCRVAHPDAHALAMQQSSLEAYAEANGFAVVGTTAEQASGLDFSRQGLAEVSGAVADGKPLPPGAGCGKDGRLSVLAGRSVC